MTLDSTTADGQGTEGRQQRTTQEGATVLLRERAVVDGNEGLDFWSRRALVPELDPSADLARSHWLTMVGLAGIRRGTDALDAQERELLVEVFAQVVVQPPVGRQADLASRLLGDSNEILQLVSLQRSVLVAADHAVDVEEEDAQAGRLRARLWGVDVGHRKVIVLPSSRETNLVVVRCRARTHEKALFWKLSILCGFGGVCRMTD